jgi:hypothetical protein
MDITWVVFSVVALAFALTCRAARKGIERAYAEGVRAGKTRQDTGP